MNYFKAMLMLKEFPFLGDVLRKQVALDLGTENIKPYEKRQGFRIEEKIGERYCKISFTEKPDSLMVKKCDKNLLAMKPCIDEYSWSRGGHCNFTNCCAVVGKESDAELYWLERDSYYATGSGDRNSKSASNVGEQLMELNINPDFIVVYDFQDTDDNGNGEVYTDVIIYKMKDFDLGEYHCRQIDKAATQLKDEIRTACTAM